MLQSFGSCLNALGHTYTPWSGSVCGHDEFPCCGGLLVVVCVSVVPSVVDDSVVEAVKHSAFSYNWYKDI